MGTRSAHKQRHIAGRALRALRSHGAALPPPLPRGVPPCPAVSRRAAPAPRPPPPATRMPAPLSGESRDTAHPVPGAARGVPRVGRGRRRGMRGAAGPFSARVPAGRGRAAPGGPGWARAGSGSPSVRPCFPSASSESGLAVGRAPSGRAPNVTAAPGPRGGAAAPAPRFSRRGGSDVSGGEEKPKRFPPPEKRGQSRPRARSGAEFPPEPRPRRAHARRPQPPEPFPQPGPGGGEGGSALLSFGAGDPNARERLTGGSARVLQRAHRAGWSRPPSADTAETSLPAASRRCPPLVPSKTPPTRLKVCEPREPERRRGAEVAVRGRDPAAGRGSRSPRAVPGVADAGSGAGERRGADGGRGAARAECVSPFRFQPCPVFRLSMGPRLKEPARPPRATVTTLQENTAPIS